MANVIGSAWRSFWHTMTSYDRHASHDSPYRSGKHVPLSQSRHEPLTSIATSAIESRPDLTAPYDDDHPKGSNGWSGSPTGTGSPNRPYSPGMRSLSSQKRQSTDPGVDGPPEIQMQSFHDGAPPPPPVSHSWGKIDRWLEHNYEELFDNLCEGCTQNDINELEHELDCSLPLEVRESLMMHDGQERPGLPTGVIFGCMLLDCEEIVQEWKNWRTVNEEFLSSSMVNPVPKAAVSSSSAAPPTQAANPMWRQDLLERQDSQPLNAVQKAYAHPAWIPLARDWGGNHIAIDLAPGPAGKWGQVILFGRDYDCKYVVARSWAAFLAMFADDICSGKVHVDEETNELKLLEFKAQNVEPPYLEILRWRTDQKYGRKPPRRKTPSGLGLSTGSKSGKESPYGSPTPSEERGRSPHRFSNRVSTQSPKTQFGISSPLARVTEEAPSPVHITADAEYIEHTLKDEQTEDLMEVATPQISGEENDRILEAEAEHRLSETGKVASDQPSATGLDSEVLGEMKNVTI
ncbi:SMI1/KNR4 family protein [Aspergillus saccharolyticus JOP 1030-1]|uniref:Cell wall assembly and cell proliferation coordinating protein n=1 Tax=Aspergillus saccharolyticus JOP 1030-1 TaxID=1450539 RepID=A0A318Z7D6_9EURO|nr:cell wall assembly and cell proliferation coordinating protein [Aspergillus saccharolyticus JOP 1030-1]PYH40663.1 cell wall assembly and cell proliferation coordinating protein [Aspergillus saccharolyticus JOP 1030-1]